MYDKRKRARRIKSPNPSHIIARNYNAFSKVCKNLKNMKNQKKMPNSYQERNKIIPFYGITKKYGNLFSEKGGEEGKLMSNFIEGDMFKPMKDIKMQIFSSKSSGAESPTSFAMRPPLSKSNFSVTSSWVSFPRKPEVRYFKAIRNAHSGKDKSGLMSAKIMATSPIAHEENINAKLIISNPSLRIESVSGFL